MLNLGPIINQGNPGRRGGFLALEIQAGEGSRGTGNPGGRGDQKLLPSVRGMWIFSGITHLVKLALFQICQTTLSVENYCSADKKSLTEILVFLQRRRSV